MSKPKTVVAEEKNTLFTVRFVIALLLMVAGIAWLVFYYTQARGNPLAFPPVDGSPKAVADLGVESRDLLGEVAGLVTLGTYDGRQVGEPAAAQVEAVALLRAHREEDTAEQHDHRRRHAPDATAPGAIVGLGGHGD